MEHIAFALRARHPDEEDQLHSVLPDRVRLALDWEKDRGSQDIDAFRLASFRELESRAASVRNGMACSQPPDSDCNPVAARLNLPLFHSLFTELNYQALDPNLLDDLAGFPLVGQLPRSGPDARPDGRPTWNPVEVEQLRRERKDRNVRIIAEMRPSEWDDDLTKLTLEDSREGFCSVPQLLTSVIVLSKP